jgi:hypothetical protein
MSCLFIEIYWSAGETDLKQYWIVLQCDFEDISNIYSIINLVEIKLQRGQVNRYSFRGSKPIEVPI